VSRGTYGMAERAGALKRASSGHGRPGALMRLRNRLDVATSGFRLLAPRNASRSTSSEDAPGVRSHSRSWWRSSTDDPRLGRRIDRTTPDADPTGPAGHVHDGAAPATDHRAEHGVRPGDRPPQVQRQRCVPRRLVRIQEQGGPVTPALFTSTSTGPNASSTWATAALTAAMSATSTTTALPPMSAASFPAASAIPIGHDHVRALGGQPPDGGRPDARRPSGHECEPPLEPLRIDSHRAAMVRPAWLRGHPDSQAGAGAYGSARVASPTAMRARALLLISWTLACTATVTPVSGA
jgi:hypothetical protein